MGKSGVSSQKPIEEEVDKAHGRGTLCTKIEVEEGCYAQQSLVILGECRRNCCGCCVVVSKCSTVVPCFLFLIVSGWANCVPLNETAIMIGNYWGFKNYYY